MTDIQALIARLEAATGPDRKLDAAIAVASGQYVYEKRGRDRQEWFYSTARNYDRRSLHYGGTCNPLEAYTASIDAALTLVPEGYGWRVEAVGNGPSRAIVGGRIHKPWLDCATPALAICIAALKARATDGGEG